MFAILKDFFMPDIFLLIPETGMFTQNAVDLY